MGFEYLALGSSRGGLSTKIHLTVWSLGLRIRFVVSARQKGEAPQGLAPDQKPARRDRHGPRPSLV